MAKIKSRKTSKWAWGIFLLLIAGLILSNHFGGFVELGVWSLVIAALAAAILVDCVAKLQIASLPIPIAALYYVFQAPLDFPEIRFWTLALVALLVTIGLHVLLPRSLRNSHFSFTFNDGKRYRRDYGDSEEFTDAELNEGDDPNNPFIDMKFGHVSRYLHADSLETAELRCKCGSLEVYFDHVELSPDGAEVYVDCKLGSIEMYMPGHWRIIDNLSASLGNAEVDRQLRSSDPGAPTLTLKGNVSLGNVEVNRIKADRTNT